MIIIGVQWNYNLKGMFHILKTNSLSFFSSFYFYLFEFVVVVIFCYFLLSIYIVLLL